MHLLGPLTPAERTTSPDTRGLTAEVAFPRAQARLCAKAPFFFLPRQTERTATVTLQTRARHSQCTLMVMALSTGLGRARLLAWHSSGLPLSELKAVTLRRGVGDTAERQREK